LLIITSRGHRTIGQYLLMTAEVTTLRQTIGMIGKFSSIHLASGITFLFTLIVNTKVQINFIYII